MVVVFTLWGGQCYIIAAVHIPPPFSPVLLYNVLCPAKLLLMGDFNVFLAPDLIRIIHPKHFATDLVAWAQVAGVVNRKN